MFNNLKVFFFVDFVLMLHQQSILESIFRQLHVFKVTILFFGPLGVLEELEFMLEVIFVFQIDSLTKSVFQKDLIVQGTSHKKSVLDPEKRKAPYHHPISSKLDEQSHSVSPWTRLFDEQQRCCVIDQMSSAVGLVFTSSGQHSLLLQFFHVFVLF